jgi:hypothetical protein
VTQNRAACRVEISLELIAASRTMGPLATVPAPPITAATMLIPRNQDRVFVFVPLVVAVCFRYVNFCVPSVSGSCRQSRALLQIGFEIGDYSFI